MNFRHIFLYSAACLTSLSSFNASAVDVIPGAGVAPPPDLNIFMLSYAHNEYGDTYVNGEKSPTRKTSGSRDALLLRYSRSFLLHDRPSIFYLQPSLVKISGRLNQIADEQTGLGDTALAFAHWLHADRQQGDYLAIASYLTLPTGQYDSAELVSPGTNRYTFAQQIGYQKGLTDKFDLMLSTDARWFSDNDETPLRRQKEQKDVLYSGQVSLMFKPAAGTLLAANYYHHLGGETKVNGIAQDNEENRSRFGITVRQKTPVGRFTFEASQDLDNENGINEDYRLLVRMEKTWK